MRALVIAALLVGVPLLAVVPTADAANWCTDLTDRSCDGTFCWYGDVLPRGCRDAVPRDPVICPPEGCIPW